jgi:hypothetical protein
MPGNRRRQTEPESFADTESAAFRLHFAAEPRFPGRLVKESRVSVERRCGTASRMLR